MIKKALLAAATFFVIGFAYANYPQCQQVYVCGGGGCQWVTICR